MWNHFNFQLCYFLATWETDKKKFPQFHPSPNITRTGPDIPSETEIIASYKFLCPRSVTLVFLVLLARSSDVNVRLGFLAHLRYRSSSSNYSGSFLVLGFDIRFPHPSSYASVLFQEDWPRHSIRNRDNCLLQISLSSFRNSCFSGSPCPIFRRERQAWISGSLEVSFVVIKL